ncbi:MAG: hypothetical protein ACRCT8_06520, partial [Lacipirellulaceae bacterium]
MEWPVAAGGNGHHYQVVSTFLNRVAPRVGQLQWELTRHYNWDQARQIAERAGGHLATIRSAAENSFVLTLVDSFPRGTIPFTSDAGFLSAIAEFSPFLGAIQDPGNTPAAGWRWITGEPFEFADWAPGEPNDYLGIDERRLQVFPRNWGSLRGRPRARKWLDIDTGDGRAFRNTLV